MLAIHHLLASVMTPLKMMLEKVKEAYNKLMPAVRIPEDDCKKLINEFEEIREGILL